MRIVMDADCLVKITKAGAKEKVLAAIEVHIPPLVEKETVDDAKPRGYADALIIEQNIERKKISVSRTTRKKSGAIAFEKGELDVLSLYHEGNYDAVASDDGKFLKRLEAARIPYLTPAACLVYLFIQGHIKAREVIELLGALQPFISRDEYAVAKLFLEGKS